jgi:acetyl-CoA carboxylase biotin carboxylase subunit
MSLTAHESLNLQSLISNLYSPKDSHMFKKILIANRGEIATRITRTCREMGIETVALYTLSDRDSLHVRLASEAVQLQSPLRYAAADEILEIAQRFGAEAIHPGYGFLAEEAGFVERCIQAGIAFIGPPPQVIRAVRDKMQTMMQVQAAGYAVPTFVDLPDSVTAPAEMAALAEQVGYPLIVKSARGGRGRGARLVMNPTHLVAMVDAARREAMMIYGDDHVYLERAIAPSHYLVVPVLGDQQGNLVHLGEREGSLLRHNQKLIEESPSPALDDAQRHTLWSAALEIARLFNYQNTGAVEFLVDGAGNYYFTEIKARIQIGPGARADSHRRGRAAEPHTAGDSAARVGDAVPHQCGGPVERLPAQPGGRLTRFRLPQGPGVRIDSYGYVGCQIPPRFDPLLANLIVAGDSREMCVERMARALGEFRVVGVETNIPLHQQVVRDPVLRKRRSTTRASWGASVSTTTIAPKRRAATWPRSWRWPMRMRRRLGAPVTPDLSQDRLASFRPSACRARGDSNEQANCHHRQPAPSKSKSAPTAPCPANTPSWWMGRP